MLIKSNSAHARICQGNKIVKRNYIAKGIVLGLYLLMFLLFLYLVYFSHVALQNEAEEQSSCSGDWGRSGGPLRCSTRPVQTRDL